MAPQGVLCYKENFLDPSAYPALHRLALAGEDCTERKYFYTMSLIRDKLSNMFSKVMAGTVTREEGTILLNSLAREDKATTIRELSALIDNPPPSVFPKTILHTIALSRNKAFFNIIVACLDHRSEDVSILAAGELARLHTSDAKEVLAEHLNSDAYHVRKASAMALAEGFASEGVEILKDHIMKHPEPFFRATSAMAMKKAERRGAEALLEIVRTGTSPAVTTAAETLASMAAELSAADVPLVIEALMSAGDRKDTPGLLGVLKVVASLGPRAGGYEGYVRAFFDNPNEEVRNEAREALNRIAQGGQGW